MSGVVLRCPNCGTTKGALGECEACHEAQVRYQCTNHTPGRWLEAMACPQCGARFGEPSRPPASPPARPSPPPIFRPAPAAPPAPTRSPSGRPKAGGPWGRRKSAPPERVLERPEVGPVVRGPLATRWPELVRAASRARRGGIVPGAETPPIGSALGGCLMRAIVVALFLLTALATLAFLVGGSLLQGMVGYY